LLDEPTNDIDVNTLRALEEALETWRLRSSDQSRQWFLDRICTTSLPLKATASLFFEGNYSDYEENGRNVWVI